MKDGFCPANKNYKVKFKAFNKYYIGKFTEIRK
jgi:hypothetical protein